jgi:hypothetical protein
MKRRDDCTYWIYEFDCPYVEAPNGHWFWQNGRWRKNENESEEDRDALIPANAPADWWQTNFGDLPDLPTNS